MPAQGRATPPPTDPPDQGLSATEQATIAAVAVVLMAGLGAAQAAHYLKALLSPLGLPAWAVSAVVSLAYPALGATVPQAQPGTARGFVARTEWARRAAYLVNAVRRVSAGAIDLERALERERTYLAQHLDAGRRRRDAAQRVDEAAAVHGPVLGWYAVRDRITTPICRAAHGRNFLAARPPTIGYPGFLHGGACRCQPGPPWPGGKIMA